mmetsp:Transcript_14728/g.42157  ORF Transcript_14728/g.42157 Transcript_14728/m.42157 type:complete len:102 (+) Transcript_14728:359-664(+)
MGLALVTEHDAPQLMPRGVGEFAGDCACTKCGAGTQCGDWTLRDAGDCSIGAGSSDGRDACVRMGEGGRWPGRGRCLGDCGVSFGLPASAAEDACRPRGVS